MILYADASALVKRYIAESGSQLVMEWIAAAEHVVCSRVGFIEVYRAVMLAGVADPEGAREALDRDWERINVIKVHDLLVRRAAVLAPSLGLRSLDALHLASAESVQGPDLRLMTWDRRLWQAAHFLGIKPWPGAIP